MVETYQGGVVSRHTQANTVQVGVFAAAKVHAVFCNVPGLPIHCAKTVVVVWSGLKEDAAIIDQAKLLAHGALGDEQTGPEPVRGITLPIQVEFARRAPQVGDGDRALGAVPLHERVLRGNIFVVLVGRSGAVKRCGLHFTKAFEGAGRELAVNLHIRLNVRRVRCQEGRRVHEEVDLTGGLGDRPNDVLRVVVRHADGTVDVARVYLHVVPSRLRRSMRLVMLGCAKTGVVP